jgi:site-specific DNA-methyltransferase (adenine-specific)
LAAGEQINLIPLVETMPKSNPARSRTAERLTRLDIDESLKKRLLPFCRLKHGDIWEDPIRGHRVGVLDATVLSDVREIMCNDKANLLIGDPPYNIRLASRSTENLSKKSLGDYISFSKSWVANACSAMERDAHFYVWIGADQKDSFQPLPDFMIMMRDFTELKPRSFITLRNQRGYGTQKNWMWVRQELLHYAKGKPAFTVVYTDIPKILKGYYKVVNGRRTENLERSRSDTIRPGNVWVDIQQVFYRMEENVPGCYAQKPLKAIERIILSSSTPKDIVADFFAHSGSTLIAAEKTSRRAFTFDIDPIFVELTIRRLERYRRTGKTGWQWHNPFPEVDMDKTV